MRFEVDLAMLRESVTEATAADLRPFCEYLTEEIDEGRAVATFTARNDPRDGYLLAWVWPTCEQWRRAIERTFDVATLPMKRERGGFGS